MVLKSVPPLVSVLMPVYNAGPYLREAILSIIEQEFTDFELLVFNDGSTDDSSAIVRAIQDPRISFFDSSINKGYVTHLNDGLRMAQGKYIARMDADDVALPARFAKQVALLESEPTVGLCGTRYQMFGGLTTIIQLPSSDKQIREFMLEHCPMGHPTVMFRKSIIDEHKLFYDESFVPAEDYKLWYDFSKFSELRNIPEVLLCYRVHPYQISVSQNSKQRLHASSVRVAQLMDKGFSLSPAEQQLYGLIMDEHTVLNEAIEINAIILLIEKIILMNSSLQAYDETVMLRIFSNLWHRLVTSIKSFSPALVSPVIFRHKPIVEYFGFLDKMKFLIKCGVFWKA